MKKIFCQTVILFCLIMTIHSQQKSLDSISWIIDKWIMTEGEITTIESWEKVSGILFKGESTTKKGTDTIFHEKLELKIVGGEIYYIADVKHNPEPVKFKLTFCSDKEAHFENPAHDFPQKIIYKLIDNSKLSARIEGKAQNGEMKSSEWLYDRIR